MFDTSADVDGEVVPPLKNQDFFVPLFLLVLLVLLFLVLLPPLNVENCRDVMIL